MPAGCAADHVFFLADEAATARLAAALARLARTGDFIALIGELGAGKSVFARAFIRARAALAGAAVDEVPSPTFTLVQPYELPDGVVHHVDLFRIDRPARAAELGIEEMIADGVTLVEWPERLGPALPAVRLEVRLEAAPAEESRVARLVTHGGDWPERLAKLIDEMTNG